MAQNNENRFKLFRPWDDQHESKQSDHFSNCCHCVSSLSATNFLDTYTSPASSQSTNSSSFNSCQSFYSFKIEPHSGVNNQSQVSTSINIEDNQCKQRPRAKRFNCPFCEITFSNNGQLKGHIRTHTGERPFVCDNAKCGKTFTRNEELTRHRRIHTGIRPFACGVCNKCFGRKDHLKKHQRTHDKKMNTNFSNETLFTNHSHFQYSYLNALIPFLK